ncbi:hypothetical protein F4782DRAFT_546652 [Xylaria castorea]|nr:hypothetical protein F4782DRAFT_546652 [Xylaria castorea]
MSQLSSPTIAPAEFLPYPRLPNELKVMIWEYAFAEWSSGAHRFRLLITPQSSTKLTMRPDNDQKDDASAWRERLAFAKIDACSEYVFGRLQYEAKERNQLKLLYKDTSHNRRRRVEENGVAANIHADTDLVTFRFNYGATQASLALLNHVENREVFAGITQVGIEVEFLQRGWNSTPKYKPFRFQCTHCQLFHPPEHGPKGVVNFLSWFKDLKVVYIIFTLRCRGQHDLRDSLLDRTSALPRFRADGRRVNQSALNRFQALQDIVRQRGLKRFHDRNGTYCEIPFKLFAKFERHAHYLRELRSVWRRMQRTLPSVQENWESVQFKLLSWTDLRDATVIGDARPLRRVKPW